MLFPILVISFAPNNQNEFANGKPSFPATVTNKVHNENAIRIGTFLGGPLVAGYLIGENFKQLGEPHNVRKTWIWAIISFIAIMILAFVVPHSVPAVAFAAAYTGAASVLVKKYQSAQLKTHAAAGGGFYKTRRAIVTGFLGCLLLIAALCGCYFILDALGLADGINL